MGIIQDSSGNSDCAGGMKRCSKCGGCFPATTDFFARDTRKNAGLRYDCKSCANQFRRDARLARRKEKEAEQIEVCPEGMKQCSKCSECFPATTEFFPRDKKGKMGLHYWCKPCCNQFGRTYKHANKEYIETYRQQYEASHKQERSIRKKYYIQEKQQEIAKYMRRYRDENRERRLQYDHKRRAQAKKTGGKYNPNYITILYNLQQGRCAWCSKTMVNRILDRKADRSEKFTVDHICPIHRGGSNFWWNLILACPHCNGSHNARYVFVEWQPPAFLEAIADYVLQAVQLELMWQYWRWCFPRGIKIF